ncbi:MFS general substrate transporter [Mollisia scopiformis]|uniref:MFS general substrate transporter n=1 Tax=Mollisia scopiformis TaxID=149040 RepID=A0A132BCI6_MOLSC|nr:MFS general substrate transporter [Mollisia scopiformis]KUJ10142.1 MFS general substrate transporter [Mollisia scopiformis]
MAGTSNEKCDLDSTTSPEAPVLASSDRDDRGAVAPRQNKDTEKNASAGGTYFVKETTSDADDGLKLAKDGVTILIPQPSDDNEDPLNWTWLRKHKVLISLLLPSLLTDWGMTWGTTLFQAQAVTWGMSVPDVARSVSGGIFLQGPGGVLAVPFVQRYGRLPVLFWSQVLGFVMVLIATFMPNYASFTAFRTLQGFVATSPQVIGLSVVHDISSSTSLTVLERARKVNIWAFTFLLGPFLGPFVSSFLLSRISWQFDMGVLAMFYGVSAILVVLLGEETLYDRDKSWKPTAGASKISILVGIAGAKAKGQTSLMLVSKQLLELLIKPQLLLPTLYIMLLFTWAIGIVTTVTQFIRPPPYLLDNTQASLFYLAPIVGGLTLQKQLPVIGLAAAWSLMAFAQVASTTAISAYALDVFPHHAALASSWINFWRTTGGFCVTYFQTQWVAKSGAATTFGIQAAIIAFGFIFVIITQVMGARWRLKFPAPSIAEN